MVATAFPAATVAARGEAVGLDATLKVTIPLPLPGLLVTVTHEFELVAVHVQAGPDHTLTLPVPALAENDRLLGVMS